MIILDTSGLLACIDGSQRFHHIASRVLQSEAPPHLLSPFVLAELDYLLATRVGSRAQRLLLGEVARGAYRLEVFESEDIALALRLMEQYADLEIGLADASLVVLSHRYHVDEILTLDERHFRVLKSWRGEVFRVLPADAVG